MQYNTVLATDLFSHTGMTLGHRPLGMNWSSPRVKERTDLSCLRWDEELQHVLDHFDPNYPTLTLCQVDLIGMPGKAASQHIADCEDICESRKIQLIVDCRLY